MGFDYYKQLQSPVARTPLSFNKMVSLADAVTKTVIATGSVHPFNSPAKRWTVLWADLRGLAGLLCCLWLPRNIGTVPKVLSHALANIYVREPITERFTY